jgi:hypothetical protein
MVWVSTTKIVLCVLGGYEQTAPAFQADKYNNNISSDLSTLMTSSLNCCLYVIVKPYMHGKSM